MKVLALVSRLGAVLVVASMAVPPCARAAPLPAPHLHVSHSAHDEPISAFIQAILEGEQATVIVSPEIQGSISGQFNGDLDKVLATVTRAFSLSYYFDGQSITVYPESDKSSKTFLLPADAQRSVQVEAVRQGLLDPEDTLRSQPDGLVAVGAPAFVKQIDALVHRNQSLRKSSIAPVGLQPASENSPPVSSEELEYRVYYLRYGWAADVKLDTGSQTLTVPGIATLLRGLIEDSGDVRDTKKNQSAIKPAALPGLNGSGLAAQGRTDNEQTSVSTLAGLFGLNSATNLNGLPDAAASPRILADDQTPRRNLVRIEADPQLNAVVIRDTRKQLDLYGPLIAALDVEPALVEIEATIIDIDIERARQTGFSLSFTQADGTGFTNSLDGTIPNFPQSGGVSFTSVVGDKGQFIAKLEALQTAGVARILSKPLVMTLSDVEANFRNDQTFYVPVSGSLSTDLYNVTAGTHLQVTPHVIHENSQDRIRLIVQVEDGTISTQLVGNLPVVQKSSLNTEALILSGQSLLVGGMVTQSNTDYHSIVPGVANIPLLGSLFKASSVATGHTERLFLITPRLSILGRPAVLPPGTQEPSSQTEAVLPPGDNK